MDKKNKPNLLGKKIERNILELSQSSNEDNNNINNKKEYE
jgi:hypothetical protein